MNVKGRALAVITARGGSKRIPRKNVRPFLGQPIIKYSIDAALGAGIFDEVMVSSDDDEIIALARSLGAQVPFKRSAETSNDVAGTEEVLLEVVEEYRKRGREFDHVCCLYPTAPFVTPARLRQALAMLEESGADGVVPVTRFGAPIQRSLKIEGRRLAYNWPENENRRSQDLAPAYHDCGQFYFLRADRFRAQRALFMPHTLPALVPESEAQDIDTLEDWRLAELKYKAMLERERTAVERDRAGWADDDRRTVAKFEALVNRYGIDHRSLDWGSPASQAARFEVLVGVAGPDRLEGASLLDVGCGTGDLFAWLTGRGISVAYSGLDLAPAMIEAARARFPGASFRCGSVTELDGADQYDYVMASGIFFLRQSQPTEFVRAAVERMFASARRAVAFNSLSAWSPSQDAGEYYADPAEILALCHQITPWVSLRHDYHPGDFTVYLYRDRPG